MLENIAFYIFLLGLMSQIVKLGDWVLLPHQQDKINMFMQKISVYLQEVRPFDIHEFLISKKGVVVYALPGCVLIGITIFIIKTSYPYRLFDNWSWSIMNIVLLTFFLIFVGVLIFLLFGSLYGSYLENSDMLQETDSFKDFAFKKIKDYFGFTVYLILFSGIIWLLPRIFPNGLPSIIKFILVIIALWTIWCLIWFLIDILPMTIIFGIWILSKIFYLIISFSEKIAIRIVIYQKGAWQAMLLLITIICGLFTVYFQFIKSHPA